MSEPFDPHSKSYYRQWFEKRQIPVESEYESFLRARKIDLLVRCDDAARDRLHATVFAHFRQVNSIEFKGIHDPLTLADFRRIQMRMWGMDLWSGRDQGHEAERDDEADEAWRTAAEALLPSQMTVTIVCVTRPDKLLNVLAQELRIQPTEQRGVYFCDSILPTWIIHPSELALTPVNYPLLPLARGKTLADFIEICVLQGWLDELQFTLDVGLVNDPDPLWRKLKEVSTMQIPVKEETWQYVDEFFRNQPGAIYKLSIVQEVINTVENEAKNAGITIGKQEGIDIGKQEGIDIGKQAGIDAARRQMIHAMIENNFDRATIVRLLALPEAEVLRLLASAEEGQPLPPVSGDVQAK